jgi:hypothetical protein
MRGKGAMCNFKLRASYGIDEGDRDLKIKRLGCVSV